MEAWNIYRGWKTYIEDGKHMFKIKVRGSNDCPRKNFKSMRIMHKAEVIDKIFYLAKEHGIGVSGVIRQMITYALENMETSGNPRTLDKFED